MIRSFIVGAVCVVALAGCGGGSSSVSSSQPPTLAPSPHAVVSPSPSPAATAASLGSIQHIVVIMQENRSFDNLFHGFPNANSAQSGLMSNGTSVVLHQTELTVKSDVNHAHTAWYQEYDGGKLDGFNLNAPSPQPPEYPYAYVDPTEIAPYWTLAQNYTLADDAFQSNSGPSYVSHQYLIAGQSASADENPDVSLTSGVWGCDDPVGTTVSLIGPNGTDLPGPFPCFDYQTIGDELDAANISWRYYAPSTGAPPAPGAVWSAYDAISHIRYGADWTKNIISPETTILHDIVAGQLQTVSWVVPSFPNSDHAPDSDGGPAWVSSIVYAIGASSYWKNTAIIIAWDDWGGWYDHVPPPQIDAMGLGFRVPLLVVSPFAKRGYVSHVQRESPVSILSFIEHRYGLAALTARDASADALGDCFDFSQPIQPLTKLRAPKYPMHWGSTKAPDND